MAKTKISEFSSTPANNTDIDSINIAEGCAPSGINDAIRELMAQLKDFQTGAQGDSFNGPIGTSTAAAGAFTTLSASSTVTLSGGTANGVPYLNGSKVLTSGSALSFDSSLNILSVSGGINSIIGATNPLAGAFTTINASGAVTFASASTLTLSGGIANGVAYLNGSKVVTSGSALTFDGTSLGVKAATTEATNVNIGGGRSGSGFAYLDLIGDAAQAASYSARLIRGNGGANATTSLIHKGTGALEFTASDAGYLTYNINGSEVGRFTSTGLGIGTSSPAFKVDLGFTDTSIGWYLNSTYSGSIAYTTATRSMTIGVRSADAVDFISFKTGTDFSEKVRITTYGNLGIGTSSPTNKLDILTGDNTGLSVRSTNYSGSFGPSGLGGMALTAAGAYPLFFYINGATRATLDSSGNLGLGVTPSAWTRKAIQLGDAAAAYVANNSGGATVIATNMYFDGSNKYATTAAAARYSVGTGTHEWYTAPSGTAGNAITFTQAMTLTAAGELLVGTTTSNLSSGSRGVIELNGSGSSYFGISTAGTLRGTLYSSGSTMSLAANSIPITFGKTDGTEWGRFDSSGNLLVGTTSTSVTSGGFYLSPSSVTGYTFYDMGHANGVASGSAYSYYRYNGSAIGSITQSGTTAVLYNTTSDQRLKQNIQDADSASALIDALQVRKFDWKADGSHQRYGFVAQELATVYPEAVHQPADTEQMMAVDYSKLVPLLVKEIQSLKARLDAANL